MLRPIAHVAEELGLSQDHVTPWGHGAAKISLDAISKTPGQGKVVLVSAITPTPAGEGKTTVSVGLGMGLRAIGTKAVVCLREPSLGPVFGIKGGGTGGGQASLEPADRINLHFTGDIHAVSSAHNLLAALVDNALKRRHGRIDPRSVLWSRVVDMNDRALRTAIVGIGEGIARETRFDITAASEIMAVLALASDFDDLRARLGRMIVGRTTAGEPVTVDEMGVSDALAALLVDAACPNLVQTGAGGPALVHAGPFANIAHGCSSVIATKLGRQMADVVVTEAGFGFELGGEKFLQLKCRQAGLWPHCVVLVATVKALMSHGQGTDDVLGTGLKHLERQIGNVGRFGLKAVIAINVFGNDSAEDLARIEQFCAHRGVRVARITGFSDGEKGGKALAHTVVEQLAEPTAPPQFLYNLGDNFRTKLNAVARGIYGAAGVEIIGKAGPALRRFNKDGLGHLPICIAKTHLSFSDDPKGGGLAEGHTVTVTDARISAGAGFVVALMGDISTMPGLPAVPAANRVRILDDGTVTGLMQGS